MTFDDDQSGSMYDDVFLGGDKPEKEEVELDENGRPKKSKRKKRTTGR
ncbi:hypothetical protein GCM10010399_75470 [Dactylosporangium fulvum]|uniref:Uncharacterized protein n=1 Tax=Dactylosporangium fulvum TaxID=53359 RepID=A0ABY5VQT7_9ACTN|nr:hypothetical protein [Dactylosporangium fulvum]UWP79169.1 hypothetical protein Dfulv_28830 [Dactylosporangium fulvum]